MSTDQICNEIVKKVCSSNLHFNINQTPYSLYITIRKKLLKASNSVEAASAAAVVPEPNRAENFRSAEQLESRNQALEIENNFVKHE